MKKLKNQQGSATIEATISLIGFIFVIMAIYAIVNFCIVQAKMANAINTTAKEISQYSYFYHALGLQGAQAKLDVQKQQAVGVYEGISSLIDNPSGEMKDASGEGKDAVTKFIGELKDIPVEEQMAKMQQAHGIISGIVDNPAQFMKSIAALAGSKALDKAKSQLVASPISKGLTRRHFGKDVADANEYLKKLGVENGYDGVNFNMSTMFVDKSQNIDVVVYYKLDLASILPIGTASIFPNDLKIIMHQRASARAWLGGDLY